LKESLLEFHDNFRSVICNKVLLNHFNIPSFKTRGLEPF
jgi:hypothetical protein